MMADQSNVGLFDECRRQQEQVRQSAAVLRAAEKRIAELEAALRAVRQWHIQNHAYRGTEISVRRVVDEALAGTVPQLTGNRDLKCPRCDGEAFRQGADSDWGVADGKPMTECISPGCGWRKPGIIVPPHAADDGLRERLQAVADYLIEHSICKTIHDDYHAGYMCANAGAAVMIEAAIRGDASAPAANDLRSRDVQPPYTGPERRKPVPWERKP